VKEDMVNKPPHYQEGGIETIDVIEAKLGGAESDHLRGYYLGNSIKYLTRAMYKGKFLEDIKKARYYLDKLIQCYGEKRHGKEEEEEDSHIDPKPMGKV
tara:strand:- start:1470 stop:1766 length:297 start_codon:yes stop_codon:yes gene_type:complete